MNIRGYHTPTEVNTSGSIRIAEMAREYTPSPTKIAIWVHGRKISFQEMAFMYTKKAKNIKENSLMVRSMERASITTTVEQFFKGSGTKIESMVLGFSPIPTLKSTKATG